MTIRRGDMVRPNAAFNIMGTGLLQDDPFTAAYFFLGMICDNDENLLVLEVRHVHDPKFARKRERIRVLRVLRMKTSKIHWIKASSVLVHAKVPRKPSCSI